MGWIAGLDLCRLSGRDETRDGVTLSLDELSADFIFSVASCILLQERSYLLESVNPSPQTFSARSALRLLEI